MAAHENNICIETSELDLEEASIAQEEADIYCLLLSFIHYLLQTLIWGKPPHPPPHLGEPPPPPI